VEIDPCVDAAEGRYLLAHMVGHLATETETCNRDLLDQPEADASTFAAYLLLPGVELRRLTKAMAAGRTLRNPGDFTLIAEVAERFGVPFWMAARRAADEGVFDELAEVGD
jgi:Zn-dependent peptidase ImmA (M78 family)